MVKDRKKERYEVLYEDVRAMFRVVLEGHSTLNQTIETVREEVREVKEGLGYVEKAVTENSKRLGTLINRFEAHDHAHTA